MLVDEATGQVLPPSPAAAAAANVSAATLDDEVLRQHHQLGGQQPAWMPRPTQMVRRIGYAVSAEFVVATRRVKQAHKAEIPLMHDPVARLEHVGCVRPLCCATPPRCASRGRELARGLSRAALLCG